jgi:uncharacterized protein YodC (DUF2158 family)
MTKTFKSGDLVVLKSGGPVMTIDTVNTSIFDDEEITGLLCVWFVGETLQRVRFDHRAIEPAKMEKLIPQNDQAPSQQDSGEYSAALDEMVGLMNQAVEEMGSAARERPTRRKTSRKSKVSVTGGSPEPGP